MKTFFKISAIILFIIAAIAFVVFCSFNGIEKETSGVVSEAVNAISDSWNPAELTSRAEPGLIKAMQSQGQSVEDLFRIYRTLGKPDAPITCTIKNTTTFKGASDSYTSASYVCDGHYENGPAAISITLRKGSSQSAWRIYHINIESPHFATLPEH